MKAAGLWAAASAGLAGLAAAGAPPFAGPRWQPLRAGGASQPLDWEAAVRVVQDAFRRTPGSEIAFLLGLFPDHLADLVYLLASGGGQVLRGAQILRGAQVLRYDARAELEGQVPLMDAAQKTLGAAKVPVFDFEGAELVFAFGVQSSEPWLAGLHEAAGRRVDFSAQRSLLPSGAGEWVPIRPGSEAWVAQALARLVAEFIRQPVPGAFAGVDLRRAAEASGLAESELHRLAQRFARAGRKVAVPGGVALSAASGLEAAEAVLALNVVSGSLGQPGGVWLPLAAPLYPQLPGRPGTLAEVQALVERIRAGQIQVLFIHGVDPVAELPQALDFAAALEAVPVVISLASSPDATSRLADYVLPDRPPLESWGYQKHLPGEHRLGVSGFQPALPPPANTPSTADLLLAAARGADPSLAAALPFDTEIAFLRHAAAVLDARPGAWERWVQSGGWRASEAFLEAPAAGSPLNLPLDLQPPPPLPEDQLVLLPARATGAGNAWVELHPRTAARLGIRSGERVRLASGAGSLEARARPQPTIHPEAAAVPWEAGLLHLVELAFNTSGSLAASNTRVRISRLI